MTYQHLTLVDKPRRQVPRQCHQIQIKQLHKLLIDITSLCTCKRSILNNNAIKIPALKFPETADKGACFVDAGSIVGLLESISLFDSRIPTAAIKQL